MQEQTTREQLKQPLPLPTDLKKVMRTDGKLYTVRLDRRRVFFPDEWEAFRKEAREKHRPLFDFMLNTGCRIEEARFIRPCDFDFERGNVRLWKTKTKARKGEKQGKPRTVSLSSEFTKRMFKYSKSFNNEEFIFKATRQSLNQLMKSILKRIGVKDYYNFSTHNIRKTHGMYLKALGIDIGEICTRLGHDYNTYISHYGSADIFSDSDIRRIKDLLGDLYMRQRRF